MSRILGALVALGIARLLPEHGAGLWLRLGAATLALLLPFAGRGAAEALAWSVGALFVSLAITFAVHASLSLTLALYGALALLSILSPWLYAPSDARRRLVWFGGATLLAGALAVRAYMTAT